MADIRENLARVREQITESAGKAGRAPDEIDLVAISKTHDADRVREAIDAFKISLWSSESAAAHVALGGAYLLMKDLDAAKTEAARALNLEPASPEAQQLLKQTTAR